MKVFLKINGTIHYLWRAVDQDGIVLDILVQPKRDRFAAMRFFRKLLRSTGRNRVSSLLISCAATLPRNGSSCLVLHIGNIGISIAGPRTLTSLRVNAKDGCGASNPPGMRNAFSQFTESLPRISGPGGICYLLPATAESVPNAFKFGTRLLPQLRSRKTAASEAHTVID